MRTKSIKGLIATVISFIICGLVLPSYMGKKDPYVIESEGIAYRIWHDDEHDTLVANVIKGKDAYTGDVVIADTVMFNGTACPVEGIEGGFFGELSGLYVPNTVEFISDGAFAYCKGLDSINLPIRVNFGYRSFEFSSFKKFYFREIPGNPSNLFYLSMVDIGWVEAEVVDIAPIEYLMFEGYRTRRVNLHHVDEIVACTLQPGVDYFVMDDTVPPSFYTDDSRNDPEVAGVTVRSLLFVPDQAVEAYESAYYWRRFAGIYPKSRLDEVDRLLSSSVKEIECERKESIDIKIDGKTIYLSGEGEELYKIYDTYGRLVKILKADENSTSLEPGTYIVNKGSQTTKVNIR